MIEESGFRREPCDSKKCLMRQKALFTTPGLGPIVKRGNYKFHLACTPGSRPRRLTKGDIIK
jgi:hypothetical protein